MSTFDKIILIYIHNGATADITPSSQRPREEIFKMNRLCNRSSIGSAKPTIGCENQAIQADSVGAIID